ncbi:fibrillin-1-like [Mercenaria mercenaria]|uniref:fibrillin-1-like n=1 Tax=Mercenaria mercenaria TaxID=6596 RepID=UPI00234EA916|nr:fibrillin-1-like [Mercenaria mercenaria]
MLSLNTIVPQALRNVTAGLLGNYDGDVSNEFMMPNGTVLFTNISEREVFAYCKTWAINPNRSAFMYSEGKTHYDYHNDSYVPGFLDEVDPNKRTEAEKACNGSQNIECVYDLVFTEKTEIAKDTNRITSQADWTRSEMGKTVPSLKGCETVNAVKGENVTCRVTLDEGSSIHFIENNASAVFNHTTSTVSYIQLDESPAVIRFSAKNSKDRFSPSFIMSVLLCTGCNGRGYCTDEPREDPRETEYFKYATCVCQPEYEDINECDEAIHNCSHTCNNTMGGFSCLCFPGYIFNDTTWNCDASSDGKCTNEEIASCGNTDGCIKDKDSFRCFCESGYELDDTEKACKECEVPFWGVNCINMCECMGQGTDRCDPGKGCICAAGWTGEKCNIDIDECQLPVNVCKDPRKECNNNLGSYMCNCRQGYIESSSGLCEDINECKNKSLNLCADDAECINIEGSFKCKCPVGTQLENDGRTCSVCDEFHYGKECSQSCSCLHGHCDKTLGCVCKHGWGGRNCDIDRNECESEAFVCEGENTECVNTPGSAMCSCMTGFINVSGICRDIDECKTMSEHNCDQQCINTVGSYRCDCQNGFVYQEETCTDINECLHSHQCDQICENTVGSYRCLCEPGFSLNLTDRKSCLANSGCAKQDKDKCGGNATCFVVDGKPNCICNKGFSSSGDICIDIDECTAANRLCSQYCNNTLGSYTCHCSEGFYLMNDGITCQECYEGWYGHQCELTCSCVSPNTESCDKVNGKCNCKKEWQGYSCNEDVDECKMNISYCPINSDCENKHGSYGCKCEIGYYKTGSGNCAECDSMNYGKNCNEECKCSFENALKCNNVDGTCMCKMGWQGSVCLENKDECTSNNHTCSSNSKCLDTHGSYNCVCDEGFHKQGDNCIACSSNTFGKDCSTKCSCNVEHSANKTQTCDIVTGQCKCLPNWQGDNCNNDINECDDSLKCKNEENKECRNTIGWYTCECINGYKEYPNGKCVKNEPIMIDLSIRVYLPERIDLNDPVQKMTLETNAIHSLDEFYRLYTKANIEIHITDIRWRHLKSRSTRVSLMIDYTVTYEEYDFGVASALTAATIDLCQGTVLLFGGNNVTVATDSFKDMEPCEVYHDTVGSCGEGYQCVRENSYPICRLTVNDPNLPLIIGVSVGGFILVLIIVIVIVCIGKHKQNRKIGNRDMIRISSASDLEKKLNADNPRPPNVYNQLILQNFSDAGNKDSEESKYMTWKSMVPTFTMPSQKDTVYNQHFQIPCAIMEPDYINPRT